MKSLMIKATALLFLIFSLGFRSVGQQEQPMVTILNPGDMYSTYTFGPEEKQSVITKMGESSFNAIDHACREDQWPSGISSLEKRNELREKMKEYNCHLVLNLGERSVISINPAENAHMPAEMLGSQPFYIIFNTSALSSGPSAAAGIVDPGQLLSTYNFTNEEKEVISARLGSPKYEQINNACHESQWPSGLATLDRRTGNRETMKKFKINVLLSLNDISILEMDPESNRHMPLEMQSGSPFFFVIENPGIGIEKKEKVSDPDQNPLASSEEKPGFPNPDAPQATIVDPELIMESYDFDANEKAELISQIGEEGFSIVNANCRESSFPAGINKPEKRKALAYEFLGYNAYVVAEFGDYSLLQITPEDNKDIVEDLRPLTTFYIVIITAGIEVLE